MLNTSMTDKQHALWLHSNTLLKPMHSVAPPNLNHSASEYAEVAQIMPKTNAPIAPPEPYATVNMPPLYTRQTSVYNEFH